MTTTWRFEALAGAYRQLASGLSGLVRVYRAHWPEVSRGQSARDMVAGALAQLEALGVNTIYIQDEDPSQPGSWMGEHSRAPISIEWHEESPGPCSICAAAVGSGPVGWRAGTGPVCDPCLLEQNHGLGSLLRAINVMRELGSAAEHGEDQDEVMIALLTYARIYDRAAAKSWPYRRVGYLEYLRELGARFRKEPRDWKAIKRMFPRGSGDIN